MIFRKEDKNFVTFDSNGFIDEATIAGHTSDSWLYNSTIAMVKDNEIIELEVGDVYYYSDNSGAIHYKKLGDIDYDGEEFEDIHFEGVGTITGETGLMGATLLPGTGSSEVNSIDNNSHVIINKNLSVIGALETIGHELFGHALIYSKTKDRNAAAHNFEIGNKDLNSVLINNIITARKEIINNIGIKL